MGKRTLIWGPPGIRRFDVFIPLAPYQTAVIRVRFELLSEIVNTCSVPNCKYMVGYMKINGIQLH